MAQKAEQPAITTPEGVVTFRQLEERANALRKCGGEVVYASGHAVNVAAALVAGWTTGRMVHVLEADRSPHPPAIRPPVGTALIKQTVGASGVRRCQFFTLDQVMADVDRIHAAVKIGEHSAVVAPISMGHSYGLSIGVFQVLRHGVHLVWLPHPFPEPVSKALEGRGEVLLAGVPSLWKAWCLSGVQMSAVHTGLSAGARLTVALERRLREACGLKVRTLYGTSESGAVSLDMTDCLRECDEDAGELLPGVEAAVNGGRVEVRSSSVGLSYDQREAGDVFDAGCHLTWDLGEVREGRLFLHGTCGAGINVAGRKLSPAEVAAKMRLSTGLAITISGFKSRDPERCEELAAHVPLPACELTQDFKAKACERLAPWEMPRRWLAVEES